MPGRLGAGASRVKIYTQLPRLNRAKQYEVPGTYIRVFAVQGTRVAGEFQAVSDGRSKHTRKCTSVPHLLDSLGSKVCNAPKHDEGADEVTLSIPLQRQQQAATANTAKEKGSKIEADASLLVLGKVETWKHS